MQQYATGAFRADATHAADLKDRMWQSSVLVKGAAAHLQLEKLNISALSKGDFSIGRYVMESKE